MHKDLATLRHEAQTLRKAANREQAGPYKRMLERKAVEASKALSKALSNQSYLVPPRTPWKRLLSPKQYFEELT